MSLSKATVDFHHDTSDEQDFKELRTAEMGNGRPAEGSRRRQARSPSPAPFLTRGCLGALHYITALPKAKLFWMRLHAILTDLVIEP
ncbi:MAG: hypothetical protein M1337_01075 [Actinobacteria bacterium]|nr:hypothetical protein [Actinomycetota bacterium]